MSKSNYLKELVLRIESLFSNYSVTLIYGRDDDVTEMIIHANNNIFSAGFLQFLFDRIQGWLVIFRCDDTDRPVIKIYVS